MVAAPGHTTLSLRTPQRLVRSLWGVYLAPAGLHVALVVYGASIRAGSTLVAFALFRPVRSRVQAVVDRRFYRHKYDSGLILDVFASHVREEVDLQDLTDELATTVDQTMQPRHASVWLRGQET